LTLTDTADGTPADLAQPLTIQAMYPVDVYRVSAEATPSPAEKLTALIEERARTPRGRRA